MLKTDRSYKSDPLIKKWLKRSFGLRTKWALNFRVLKVEAYFNFKSSLTWLIIKFALFLIAKQKKWSQANDQNYQWKYMMELVLRDDT